MRHYIKFVRTIFTILGILALYQMIIRLVRKRWHFPAPAFIGKFLDSDYRRKMQPPEQVLDRSGIKEGMRVLEIGCGSGAFTTSAARRIGKTGRLYALDIQPDMLVQLQLKLLQPEYRELDNVELINKSAYELPFADGSLDAVYMVTVLQEIPDKGRTLAEVRRVLKPGGILAVSEWLFDPDYPWMWTTAQQCLAAGFQVDALEGGLWQYTVRMRR